MRFAAMNLWGFTESLRVTKAAAKYGEEAEGKQRVESIERAQKELEETISAAGFEVSRGKYGDSDPVVRHPTQKMPAERSNLLISDILEKQFPKSGGSMYRRYSGFVHGTPSAHATATRHVEKAFFSPWISEEEAAETYSLVMHTVLMALDSAAKYGGMRLNPAHRRLVATAMIAIKWWQDSSGRDGSVMMRRGRIPMWHFAIFRMKERGSVEDGDHPGTAGNSGRGNDSKSTRK